MRFVVPFFLAVPFAIQAQTITAARPIGPVVARAAFPFSDVGDVVSLSDGSVLVVDRGKHLVVRLDSALGNPRLVLDSASGRDNSFAVSGLAGAPMGATDFAATLAARYNFLAPFRADSSIWYDVNAGAFLVIDPQGGLGRTIAPPSARTPVFSPVRTPRVLATGHLVHLEGERRRQNPTPLPGQTLWLDDSLAVVVFDLRTRSQDTVAMIASGEVTRVTRRENAGAPATPFVVTLPRLFAFHDEVVATSDGTIAVFRAREYRIEWIRSDGTRLQGERLTYPWQRVTSEDRERMVDSINTVRRRTVDSMRVQREADSIRTGGTPMVTRQSTQGGVVVSREVPAPPIANPTPVSPDEIPDYLPPTDRGAVMADADGHVWVRPRLPAPESGFVTWEVISRSGGVVDRVKVPDSHRIVGFGAGGHVYLVSHDGGVVTLERARVSGVRR